MGRPNGIHQRKREMAINKAEGGHALEQNHYPLLPFGEAP